MLYANIDKNFEILHENYFVFQSHSTPKADHVIFLENKYATYLNTCCPLVVVFVTFNHDFHLLENLVLRSAY